MNNTCAQLTSDRARRRSRHSMALFVLSSLIVLQTSCVWTAEPTPPPDDDQWNPAEDIGRVVYNEAGLPSDCQSRWEHRCEGGDLMERVGCDDTWYIADECEHGCTGLSCNPSPDCQPRLEHYCSGDELREQDGCSSDRRIESCAHGCADGACRPCQPQPERFCQGDELRERDGCSSDRHIEMCAHSCANGACRACQPQRYCQGNELRERDGCSTDRRIESCAYGCANGACRPCSPQAQRYCQGDELRERDGCSSDRRIEHCDHGCANGACRACQPQPQRACQGADVWENDGCNPPERIQDCAHGCVNGGCRACQPRVERSCQGANVWDDDGCNPPRQVEACAHGCFDGVCNAPPRPHACDQVQVIGPGTIRGSTNGGSTDFGSCVLGTSGSSGAEAAFSFTAPQAGRWVVDTNGSNYDTVLMARTECPAIEMETACDDDGGDGTASRMVLNLNRGDVVFILVDGFSGNGDFVLNINPECQPQAQRYCSGSDVREQDGCGNDRLVQNCVHGCANNACRPAPACVDRCLDSGRRNPGANERVAGNPNGRVLDLSIESTANCGSLRLRARSTNGSPLGAGRYFLRVGTCAEHGAVRNEGVLEGAAASISIATPFGGQAGETKEFCVTKEDGGNRAWWFSNLVVVSMRCD